jgi:hypothetical protein
MASSERPAPVSPMARDLGLASSLRKFMLVRPAPGYAAVGKTAAEDHSRKTTNFPLVI